MSTILAASAGNVLVWIVWVAAAFSCLASGVAVVSFSNPFYSALALIGNLGSLAVMYLLVSAEFVAAAQVLVYAGAVMVMFLFVIAYVGPRHEPPWSGGPRWQTVGAVLAAAAIFLEVVVAVGLKAGDRLSHTVLGYSVAIDEAQSFGRTIFEHAPASSGGVAIAALAAEIEGLGRPAVRARAS